MNLRTAPLEGRAIGSIDGVLVPGHVARAHRRATGELLEPRRMNEATRDAAVNLLNELIAKDVERARRRALFREYYRRLDGIREARVRLQLARAEIVKGG